MKSTLFQPSLPTEIQANPAKRIADFFQRVDARFTNSMPLRIYGSVAVTLYLADDPTLSHQTRDIDIGHPSDVGKKLMSLSLDDDPSSLVFQYHSVELWLIHPDWKDDVVDASALVGTTNLQPMLIHPVDLVITKMLRWSDRDYQDALKLVTRFSIDESVLTERFDVALQYYEPLSDNDRLSLKEAFIDLFDVEREF